MTSPLRIAYCAILRLHPVGFRAEFGDEMLWIFDEESRCGNSLHVLLDGLRSVFVQNLRPTPPPQPETANNIYIELDSSLPSERYAQVIITVMFCSLCLTLFMSMVVPSMSMPLNRVLFHPIGLFSQQAMPHAQRNRASLSWEETTRRYAR